MARTRFILPSIVRNGATCGIGIEIVAYLLSSRISFSQKARTTNFSLCRYVCVLLFFFFYFIAVYTQCLIVIFYPFAPSRACSKYLVIRRRKRSVGKNLPLFSIKKLHYWSVICDNNNWIFFTEEKGIRIFVWGYIFLRTVYRVWRIADLSESVESFIFINLLLRRLILYTLPGVTIAILIV